MTGRIGMGVAGLFSISLASCTSPTMPAGVASGCQPSQATANRVISLLAKPFDGDFRVVNLFDHDKPLSSDDTRANVVSLCGGMGRGGADNVNGHNGYDYKMAEGTPLLAVADGRIIYAAQQQPTFCARLGRDVQAQVVEILHTSVAGETFVTVYGHLSRIDVTQDQIVRSGDVVGLSGNTGCSGSPHLHFSVYRSVPAQGFVVIDPYGWHSAQPDPWEVDPRGAASVWLWRDGQAPALR